MHVIVSLDPLEVAVRGVHPIALPDAITLAVKAALQLQRELAAENTGDGPT